jgi:hypothetical protein
LPLPLLWCYWFERNANANANATQSLLFTGVRCVMGRRLVVATSGLWSLQPGREASHPPPRSRRRGVDQSARLEASNFFYKN